MKEPIKETEPKKSGFFDLPTNQSCRHPEHNVPPFISLPEGKGYRHICPGCGKETILTPNKISV